MEHASDLVLPFTLRGERRGIFVTNSCPALVGSCPWDVDSLALAASLSLAEQGLEADSCPRVETQEASSYGNVFRWPGASLVAWMVKRLPRQTRVRSLGREDPLEKEMATHSSIHAWKIQWTEKPGRLQSMRSQRVRHNCMTSLLSSGGPGAGAWVWPGLLQL